MKLNKTQKDVLLENIDVKVDEKGNKGIIYWSAGKTSYNVGMKSTWTKDQKEYLDGMEDRLNKRIDNLQNEVNKNFELLFNHLGIKK